MMSLVRTLPGFIIALIMSIHSGNSIAASDAYTRIKPTLVQELLTHLDISATLKKAESGQPYLIFSDEGVKAIFYFFDCTNNGCKSVQLISSFSVDKFDENIFNDWNSDALFTRAYFRDEQAILESDLNINGGITLENFAAFLAYYQNALPEFIAHVQEESSSQKHDTSPDSTGDTGINDKQPKTISLSLQQAEEIDAGCKVTLWAYNNGQKTFPRLQIQLLSTDISLGKKPLGFSFKPLDPEQSAFSVLVVDKTNCWQILKLEIQDVSGCASPHCERQTMMDLGGPLPISDENNSVHFHGNPNESN